jgi:hypothetical protein
MLHSSSSNRAISSTRKVVLGTVFIDNDTEIRYRGPAGLAAARLAIAPQAIADVRSSAQGEPVFKRPEPYGVLVNILELQRGAAYAGHIDVPADISSAAFFLVGASICPGAELVLKHVGINPTRTGVINILRAMGADITYVREYEAGGEPVADIRVKYAPLRGIRIPEDQVPLAIDEFPVLFIAAACADGETVLAGAEEARLLGLAAGAIQLDGVWHDIHLGPGAEQPAAADDAPPGDTQQADGS